MEVFTGDFGVVEDNDYLETNHVYTCVALAALDREESVYGLVHGVYPQSGREGSTPDLTSEMIGEMLESGCKTEDIETWILGGGVNKNSDIGSRNLMAAQGVLKELDIDYEMNYTGGYQHLEIYVGPEGLDVVSRKITDSDGSETEGTNCL